MLKTTQHIVHYTKEYGEFLYFKNNRAVKENHTHALAKSFGLTGGNMQPVIVTKDGYVFDGQHRVQASMIAGTPCAYIVVDMDPALTQKNIITELNINSSNWNTDTYIRSHAADDIEGYRKLVDIIDEYATKDVPYTAVIRLMNGLDTKSIRRRKSATQGLIGLEASLEQLLVIRDVIARNTVNAPTASQIASGMSIIRTELAARLKRGDTVSIKSFNYKDVVANIPKYLNNNDVANNAASVGRLFSRAYDLGKRADNKLGL